LRRAEPRWQKHLGFVFEAAARSHAERMVQRGKLPRDLVVGRWWSSRGPAAEVDILGMKDGHTHLLGEAKWRAQPLSTRDLAALRRKVVHVPDPIDDPIVALWGRAGADEGVRRSGALGFAIEDILSKG